MYSRAWRLVSAIKGYCNVGLSFSLLLPSRLIFITWLLTSSSERSLDLSLANRLGQKWSASNDFEFKNPREHSHPLGASTLPWKPTTAAPVHLANPKGLRVYMEVNWLPQASSIHQAPSQAPLGGKNRLLHFVDTMWQLSQYSEQECYIDHDLKSLCAREPGENQEETLQFPG